MASNHPPSAIAAIIRDCLDTNAHGQAFIWGGYWSGLRHGLTLAIPSGPSPFQVLDAAMRYAEPWDRQRVLDEWRKEYPTISPNKRQRLSLDQWGVEWEH